MKIERLKKSISEMTLDEQLTIHQAVRESRLTIKERAKRKKKVSGGKRVSRKKKQIQLDFSHMSVEQLESMIKQLEEMQS